MLTEPRPTRPLLWLLDLVIIALITVWVSGGISIQGKLILKHGPDLKRAVILLLIVGTWITSRGLAKTLWQPHEWGMALWRSMATQRAVFFTLFVVAFISTLASVLQQSSMRYPMFDVGLFHQIGHSLAHGAGFWSSISEAGYFIWDHASYSLVLLTPVFWLTQSHPLTLPILQNLLIWGGVAAWIWLALRLEGGKVGTLTRAVLFLGISMESLWGNLAWGFHETHLFFAAMSWAWVIFLDQWIDQSLGVKRLSRRRAFFIFLMVLIAGLSKETALLTGTLTALMLFVFIPGRYRVLYALLPLIFSYLFWKYLHKPIVADKNYFVRYYAYLGANARDAIHALFREPLRPIQVIGASTLGAFLIGILLRSGGVLPWVGLRYWPWLTVLPSFMAMALAQYPALRDSGFHYVLELWPALMGAAVVGLWKWQHRFRLRSVPFPVWLCCLSLVAWNHDPISSIRDYAETTIARAPLRRKLVSIPADASLSIEDEIGAWVSGRHDVVRFGTLRVIGSNHCVQWIVVKEEREKYIPEFKEKFQCTGNYTEIWREQGYIALNLQ